MRSRLGSLERLASLYQVVEYEQGLALDRARVTLGETDAAIVALRSRVRRSSDEGIEALEAGDQTTWQINESQREFTEWNAEELAALRQRREELMQAEAELYKASRMQLEQMKSVVGELRSKLERERARGEQREADDRYLSRARWAESNRPKLNGPGRKRHV